MDSHRSPLNIRIIEYPVTGFHGEKHYHNFLFENPDVIKNGLNPITKEFPIPAAGRADIVFTDKNNIYITEVKVCNVAQLEDTREKAIVQTIRYVNGMDCLLPLLNETAKITGLLIICVHEATERKEYDVNGTKMDPLLHSQDQSLYGSWKTKIGAAIKHLDALKADLITLTRRKKKLERSVKKLEAKREQIYHRIDVNRNTPLNILMDTVIAKGQLVQAVVSGKKIMTVDNILNDANARYFVESSTGFYNDEEELNKGKEAYFYFSPRIAPSAYAKIQKIAKIRHYASGIKEYSVLK